MRFYETLSNRNGFLSRIGRVESYTEHFVCFAQNCSVLNGTKHMAVFIIRVNGRLFMLKIFQRFTFCADHACILTYFLKG